MDFKLYLKVPYDEKDQAKRKGARWDAKVKKWFIPFYKENFKAYEPFLKWILADSPFVIVPNEDLYIMEAYNSCWKCGKETKVIAFSVQRYVILEAEDEDLLEDYWEEYFDRENPYLIMFPESEEDIPLCIRNYVKEHYYVEDRYSKTLGRKQFANYCKHCNALQGNYHLFQESSSPFVSGINNKEQIRMITIVIDDATIGLKWNTFLKMYISDYEGRLLHTEMDLVVNDTYDNLYKATI